MWVMVLIGGCVGYIQVIEGNYVINGVIVLISIVLVDLLYVYFDVDECIYLQVLVLICGREGEQVFRVKVVLFIDEFYG